MVHTRLRSSHGPAELALRLDEQDRDNLSSLRATWFALFKTSLHNEFCNLTRTQARTACEVLVDPCEGWDSPQLREPLPAEMRAVELACDLEQAPGIVHILKVSSWDDNKARVRTARELPDGSMETEQHVLQRLGGRYHRHNYARQLALVV